MSKDESQARKELEITEYFSATSLVHMVSVLSVHVKDAPRVCRPNPSKKGGIVLSEDKTVLYQIRRNAKTANNSFRGQT